MENKSQKINCEVDSCKFQSSDNKLCTLNEIMVGHNNNCDSKNVESKNSTLCDSFECDDLK